MMFNPVLWRIMLLPEYQVLGRLPRPGYDSISRGQSGNLRTTTRLHTFALLHPKIVGEISKSRKKNKHSFSKKMEFPVHARRSLQRTRTRPVFEYTERELTKKSYSSALQRAVSNSYYSNN